MVCVWSVRREFLHDLGGDWPLSVRHHNNYLAIWEVAAQIPEVPSSAERDPRVSHPPSQLDTPSRWAHTPKLILAFGALTPNLFKGT